jgi:hypothetical protein
MVEAMTITEFLTARLDEDEAGAMSTFSVYVRPADGGKGVLIDHDTNPVLPGALRGIAMEGDWTELTYSHHPSPARVLAEVEAKRRIVAEYANEQWVMEQGHRTEWTEGGQAARETVLRLLAQPYADHPDYDEAWRV